MYLHYRAMGKSGMRRIMSHYQVAREIIKTVDIGVREKGATIRVRFRFHYTNDSVCGMLAMCRAFRSMQL